MPEVNATGKPAEPQIDTPSEGWRAMERWRALPRALRQGPEVLKEPPYLIRFSSDEDDDDFRTRQDLLDFQQFYWDACDHLGGLPFTKDAEPSGDTPPKVLAWMDDVDGQGTDLEFLLRSASINAVGFGRVGLLVLPGEDDARTPRVDLVDSLDDLDDQADGPQAMRFRRWVTRFPDASMPWLKRREEQIWTFYHGDPKAQPVPEGEEPEPGAGARWAWWEVTERKEPGKVDAQGNSSSEWNDGPTAGEGGVIRGVTQIPYIPWTTGGISDQESPPWIVFPPMWYLARANLLWMNSKSDKDWNLRWSQVAQPWAAGVTEEEAKGRKRSGGSLWAFLSPDATVSMLETSGASYANAAASLKDLEIRMDQMAHRTSANRFVGGSRQTATGVRVDLKEATSEPQAWALLWTDSATALVRLVGQMFGEKDLGYTYKLYSDFDDELAFGAIREGLDKMRDRGDIELEEYFEEYKAAGGLGQGFDAEKAIQNVRDRQAERARVAASLPIPNLPSGQAEDEDGA